MRKVKHLFFSMAFQRYVIFLTHSLSLSKTLSPWFFSIALSSWSTLSVTLSFVNSTQFFSLPSETLSFNFSPQWKPSLLLSSLGMPSPVLSLGNEASTRTKIGEQLPHIDRSVDRRASLQIELIAHRWFRSPFNHTSLLLRFRSSEASVVTRGVSTLPEIWGGTFSPTQNLGSASVSGSLSPQRQLVSVLKLMFLLATP
ncbi:uncharacterized protein LOC133803327 [Humulus lupulus]|uniref:uncharacterized protein LOC133803327 n=1 Tax=Humulus lupulus TaxID=3486 RepID=UPI002B4072F6|nr:uncharacterized protein LOC133803327 [Humulus lupulus]